MLVVVEVVVVLLLLLKDLKLRESGKVGVERAL